MLQYKTKGNVSPQGKRRVYFTCHPDDYDLFFDRISTDILKFSDSAIWFNPDDNYEDIDTDLGQMNLFVIPITTKLLTKPCRTMQLDVPFALEKHIPILPLMQEGGLDELFTHYFGDLQYLDPNTHDITAISYEEKLKKYLNSVLVSDEMAEKVRAAFDAYIFLSYRKKDRKYANELMRLIHKNDFCRDIAIWYDEFLVPGEDFNDAISHALKKSDLFTMVVTPNLINEKNYVQTVEYPEAVKQNKIIIPTELEKTDYKSLSEKYPNIPNSINAHDKNALSDALQTALINIARRENDNDPQHNFFIGLAYLEGIDVEVDHDRALQLITSAAETNEVPEAIEKLVMMYHDGYGVKRDYRVAVQWQQKLVDYWEGKYEKTHSLDNFRMLFSVMLNLSNIFIDLYDIVKVETLYRQLIDLCEEIKSEIDEVEIRQKLALIYEKLGDLWKEGRDPDEKIYEDSLQKSILIKEEILETNPSNLELCINLANVYDKLGELYTIKLGLNEDPENKEVFITNLSEQWDNAEKNFQKSISIKKLLVEKFGTMETQLSLSDSYSRLGVYYKYKSLLKNITNLNDKHEKSIIRTWIFYFFKSIGNRRKAKVLFQKAFVIRKTLAKRTESVDARNALAAGYLEIISKNMLNIVNKKYYQKAIYIREQLVAETESIGILQDLLYSYLSFITAYYGIIKEVFKLKPLKVFRKSVIQEELKSFHKAFSILQQLIEKGIKVKVADQLVSIYLLSITSVDYYDRELLKMALAICTTLAEQTLDNEKYSDKINQIKSLLQGGEESIALKNPIVNAFVKTFENMAMGMMDDMPLEDRRELSVTYLQQGNLCKEKGDFYQAENLYKFSLSIRENLVKETVTIKSRRDLSIIYEKLAKLYMEQEKFDIAEEYFQKSLPLREQLVDETGTVKSKEKLITVYENLGEIQKSYKNFDNAEDFFRKAVVLREKILDENQTEESKQKLISSYDLIADLCKQSKKINDAEYFYQKSICLRESLLENSNSVSLRLNLSANYGKFGDFYKSTKNIDKAEEFYQKSISLNELVLNESNNINAKHTLGTSYARLGELYEIRKEHVKAEKFYYKSVLFREDLVKENESVIKRRELSFSYDKLANIYKQTDNIDKAEEIYRKLLVIDERDVKELGTVDSKINLALTYGNLANLYRLQNHLDKAEEFYLKSLIIDEQLVKDTDNIQARQYLAVTYKNLGLIFESKGNIDIAEEYYKKCLAQREIIVEKDRNIENKRSLSRIYGFLCLFYKKTRVFINKAEDFCLKDLTLSESILKDTESVHDRRCVAIVCAQLASILKLRGDLDNAEKSLLQCITLREQVVKATKTIGAYEELALSYYNIAILRTPPSGIYLTKAIEIYDSLIEKCPKISEYTKYRDEIKQKLELLN